MKSAPVAEVRRPRGTPGDGTVRLVAVTTSLQLLTMLSATARTRAYAVVSDATVKRWRVPVTVAAATLLKSPSVRLIWIS